MKLNIIIPVFNEKETIEQLIKIVEKQKIKNVKKEIIIVDDCSTDGTSSLLPKLQKKYAFILLKHKKNLGKGGGIKTALKKAKGDAILTQDADLEYDPKDWQKLIDVYDPKKCPVVYGSRNIGRTNRGYLLAYICGRVLTFINNLLYGSSLTDINTGYKLIRTDIIKNADLQVDGFDFCHEITAKILKAGYTIKEVPIKYYPRSYGEGKKVKVWDAWLDFWTTLKYRFVE